MEWFLIGLSPWSDRTSPRALVAVFHAGMFSFWGTVALAPRIFLDLRPQAAKLRRRFLIALTALGVVTYVLTFAAKIAAADDNIAWFELALVTNLDGASVTKFYIDKIANTITWQAWEDIGMLVANIASVRKLELYSADANPTTNADSLLTNFIPKSEDDLGAVNNRVDSGLKFPQVTQF